MSKDCPVRDGFAKRLKKWKTKMTKEDVLNSLIALFKNVNAVDPNLTYEEIKEIKLPALAWFELELGLDKEFKKEVLFMMIEKALTKLYGGINPKISPGDKTVFNRDISIDELASEIYNDT